MTETEIEIVEGCKRGDTECQKRLYLDYGPMIKGVCVRYTADTEEAEDLFHDVFVFILTHFDQYEHITALGGWLHRITVNKAIDYVRKKRLYDVEVMSQRPLEVRDMSVKHNDGLSMDELLMFVNALPDKYRTVFNLYVIDDIPQSEICTLMGETPTNVRTLISRARAMLRKHISEYLKDDNIVL